MNTPYLIKEANYYKKLGKGHLKRMIIKYILAKTPASCIVNRYGYNKIYDNKIKNKLKSIRPTLLQIENTNFCNAKCVMCPHVIMKRKAKIMTQKEFIKICKNVLDYEPINLVTITGFGEPLIDKEIFKKIEWINKNYPKVDVDIYTNASLLTKDLGKILLGLKIHKINFSINGTEKTYKKIMGLDYKETKENIINFLQNKNKLKKKYPLTNISLMIVKENKEEINSVIKFWEKKADSIMVYVPSDWAGSYKSLSIISKNPFKNKRWPCYALFSSITVDVNGDVIMCCRDYESKIKFGNLLKKNIEEIRRGKNFQSLLKKHAEGNYKTPICFSCDNVFDSSLNWW